jgi:hypothetical protein
VAWGSVSVLSGSWPRSFSGLNGINDAIRRRPVWSEGGIAVVFALGLFVAGALFSQKRVAPAGVRSGLHEVHCWNTHPATPRLDRTRANSPKRPRTPTDSPLRQWRRRRTGYGSDRAGQIASPPGSSRWRVSRLGLPSSDEASHAVRHRTR